MRRALIALAAIGLALSMSVPAASAPTGKPAHATEGTRLRVVIDMQVMWPDCPLDTIAPPDTGSLMLVDDPTACWTGPISGDIDGTIAFWETHPNYVVGDTEYFFEVFTLLPDSGGYVYGVDEGIFLLKKPFPFRANGWVTATSDEWVDLLGAHFFETGKTSDINFWPITAYGTRASFTKASA